MKYDTLEKFCSLLTFSSISELSRKDLLENFYELKQRDQFEELLGPKEMEKEEFELSLNRNIESLIQKEIVMEQKREGEHIFIFHASKELENIRRRLSQEERKLIFQLIYEYVSLNTKKYEQKTYVMEKTF